MNEEQANNSTDNTKKSFEEFVQDLKKVRGYPRFHKIKNSIGTLEIYLYMRKHHWKSLHKPVVLSEYFKIIKTVNSLLVDNFIEGYSIKFPHRMGTLELIKKPAEVKYVDGKLHILMAVDWNATHKLWYEDEEAYKNRTIIRIYEKTLYKILYNTYNACYKNKTFFHLFPNRTLKKRLKVAIKENKIDALGLKDYHFKP